MFYKLALFGGLMQKNWTNFKQVRILPSTVLNMLIAINSCANGLMAVNVCNAVFLHDDKYKTTAATTIFDNTVLGLIIFVFKSATRKSTLTKNRVQ